MLRLLSTTHTVGIVFKVDTFRACVVLNVVFMIDIVFVVDIKYMIDVVSMIDMAFMVSVVATIDK